MVNTMKGKRSRINRQLRHDKLRRPPDFFASHHGKIEYLTYEDAAREAAGKPSIIKPYKCRYGVHYHIGRRTEQ